MDDLLDLEWTSPSTTVQQGPQSAPQASLGQYPGSSTLKPTPFAPSSCQLGPTDASRRANGVHLNGYRPASAQSTRSDGTTAQRATLAVPLAPTSTMGQTSRSPTPVADDAFADLTGFKSEKQVRLDHVVAEAGSSTGRPRVAAPVSLAAPGPDLHSFHGAGEPVMTTMVADDPFDVSILTDRLALHSAAAARPAARVSNNASAGSQSSSHIVKPVAQVPVPMPVLAHAQKMTPPPHVLGKLVEMGFDPSESLEALYKAGRNTKGEWNVAAAAESLIAHAEHSDSGPASSAHKPTSGIKRHEVQAGVSTSRREPVPAQPSNEIEDSGPGSYKTEADEIIREARRIGASVLSQAGTYWRSGKAAAQKAWEEQAQARLTREREARESPVKRNGRPRWMKEESSYEEDPIEDKPRNKDEDLYKEAPPKSRRQHGTDSEAKGTALKKPVARPIFQNGASDGSEKTRSAPAVRAVSSSDIRLPSRQSVATSPDVSDRMESYRAKGNAAWKIGQYGEAVAAYSQAMSVLPRGHIQLVTLYNNRAAAYIKIGEARLAIADCAAVIEVIGTDLRPVSQTVGTRQIELSLCDQKVKALVRQAQALELLEDWSAAESSWSQSLALASGPIIPQCNAGITRCRQMIRRTKEPTRQPASSTLSSGTQARSTMTRPTAVPSTVVGTAVERVRREQSLAEADEIQRIALKDAVDLKIDSWRRGKEANIRALLSSMNLVLWPSLDWKPISLGELITPSKVKIWYMKAISKVHPDKVNPKSSIEQKMISAAVFASLNEAWDAFRSQNPS